MRDLLDAPTALAACCGFDLCHKYILYLYFVFVFRARCCRPKLARAELWLHVLQAAELTTTTARATLNRAGVGRGRGAAGNVEFGG